MFNRRQFLHVSALSVISSQISAATTSLLAQQRFSFSTTENQFLLDQKPFQIRSGEMHPARIPKAYWKHRIQMAKAMGMNTIAIYVMWNYHEEREGVFDFSTENRDIRHFMQLCQDEGLYVLLRPGPYICGEWDLGGIPAYLLRHDDIVLRANSTTAPHYMHAVKRYIQALASIAKPLMLEHGGPILMVQIENEFGSYGSDPAYLEELRQLWVEHGISGPFYTQDGLPQLITNKTSIPEAAIGLSGGEVKDIIKARELYPQVPVMCGELYPGWLTHWGDPQLQGTDVDMSATIAAMMREKLSFNIYVIHGGTNFGFSAGANTEKGEYQPDITSYDYAAPINEQGQPNQFYWKYRAIIEQALAQKLAPLPAAIPQLRTDPRQEYLPKFFCSLWDYLPAPVKTKEPASMESLGQTSGFILYQKELPQEIQHPQRSLHIAELHDYASIHLNQKYCGAISRTKIDPQRFAKLKLTNHRHAFPLPAWTDNSSSKKTLDILVEAMGRINYGRVAVDRKGICSKVILQSTHPDHPQSEELQDWLCYHLPMDQYFLQQLRASKSVSKRPGNFFKLPLDFTRTGDVYIDMQHWTKGVVWVNGHALGRYWQLGPQQRLYCPATSLKKGRNDILIFDLHQLDATSISLRNSLV
ncbi:beta-galactosidase [Undibacterium sp. Ji22W]|uniref:beta-galactosidase n=1 Tax=Undibacterium sp. Ji22W TaxID=3413038 RepID=UPI003BF14436